MRFGSRIREVLTTSCGVDFRMSSPRTALDLEDTAHARQTLMSHLELAFGIHVSEEDVAHLQTVRDLLQCVRLRLWEQRVDASERAATVPTQVGRPGLTPLPPSLRESVARRTPSPPLGTALPTVDPRTTRA